MVKFNIDDILAMAEQIERNGQKHYRKFATLAKDPKVKDLFNQLADWEAVHERTFSTLRAQFAADNLQGVFDPSGDSELYLQAMADRHIFAGDTEVEAETELELIELALKFETDTILFFVGMKQIVPAKLGKEKIEVLIEEELRHVAFLRKHMALLSA